MVVEPSALTDQPPVPGGASWAGLNWESAPFNFGLVYFENFPSSQLQVIRSGALAHLVCRCHGAPREIIASEICLMFYVLESRQPRYSHLRSVLDGQSLQSD